MKIGIDESGTFVYTDADNSWNCVVAYVYPEVHNRLIQEHVRQLVRRYARPGGGEVKLRDLGEPAYLDFLARLHELDGVLYSIAVNASTNTPTVVADHQADQVRRMLAHVDKMLYQSGRDGVRDLARRVGDLSHQLYIQMVCQVQLVIQILHSAVLFFVQRHPRTLGRFRWRIDQKNSSPTAYEKAYAQLLPAFLQTASLHEPVPMLEGADYRWFDRFHFPEGEEPTYLHDTYGLEIDDSDERKLNIGQLVREDVRFVDSRLDAGVQVADLLASGLRRCLRSQFANNELVASRIGALMVQRQHNNVPVQLITLSSEEQEADVQVYSSLLAMRANARPMLVRRERP